jgi:hypothetical protein
MAAHPASVCGVRRANADNDRENSRDQEGSHTALLFLENSNTQAKLEIPYARVTKPQ